MGPHDHRSELMTVMEEDCSEGTMSHASSVDKLTPTPCGDGLAEQKFRVDRRKLEVMISGEVVCAAFFGGLTLSNFSVGSPFGKFKEHSFSILRLFSIKTHHQTIENEEYY